MVEIEWHYRLGLGETLLGLGMGESAAQNALGQVSIGVGFILPEVQELYGIGEFGL